MIYGHLSNRFLILLFILLLHNTEYLFSNLWMTMVTKRKYVSMKAVLYIVIFSRRVEGFMARYLMAFLSQTNTIKIPLFLVWKFRICKYVYQLSILNKNKTFVFYQNVWQERKKNNDLDLPRTEIMAHQYLEFKNNCKRAHE